MSDTADITIPLTHGKFAVIDQCDQELVSRFHWFAVRDGNTWYALAATISESGAKTTIRMHRLIVGASRSMKVDHWNRDGLDNRRSNLRTCSDSQNSQNRCAERGGSSRFKGVSWIRKRKCWHVSIRIAGIPKYLGQFKDEESAARAYDAAAVEAYGGFAFLNFPERRKN